MKGIRKAIPQCIYAHGQFAEQMTWAVIALLWLVLLVSAWEIFIPAQRPPPVVTDDCVSTENRQRAASLKKDGYQIVSDETDSSGTRSLTLCR